jgi:leader peptidase (prepilin peptidase) / N-methyltransferase
MFSQSFSLEWAIYIWLMGCTSVAAVTDMRRRIISNRLIGIGALVNFLLRCLMKDGSWWKCLLIAILFVLGAVVVWTNEQSIGGGDVKLLALVGLAVKWEHF